MTLVLPVPEGSTVTVRPGKYVQGDCFSRFVEHGKLQQVSEAEIQHIDPKEIQYTQNNGK